MYIRMNITRSTQTEQMSVDMPSWNPVTGEDADVTVAQMTETMEQGLAMLDERANVAAMRLLAAYEMIKFFPVEVQSMIIEVVDVLTGKADPAYVVKRWLASIEETQDLERQRQEHYEKQMAEGIADLERNGSAF